MSGAVLIVVAGLVVLLLVIVAATRSSFLKRFHLRLPGLTSQVEMGGNERSTFRDRKGHHSGSTFNVRGTADVRMDETRTNDSTFNIGTPHVDQSDRNGTGGPTTPA